MISLDGAALIATVYPIAVLILAVEARALRPRGAVTRLRAAWALAQYTVYGLSTVAAAMSIAYCVVGVSSGESLRGWTATFVGVTGAALGFSAVLVAVRLVAISTIDSIDSIDSKRR